METFTVQAIYEKGVLKPRKKLNLPEHSLVELRVKTTRVPKQKMAFASLIGMWEDTPENKTLDLDKSLARVRRRSRAKVNKLAKALK